MCLFTCGDSGKGGEEEIVVPARPVQPTIIRTTTTTLPVQDIRPTSGGRGNVIVLEQMPSRTSRTSQQLYPVEPQRSNSRSPRSSVGKVYTVQTRRSTSRSPRTSNQEIIHISPPMTPLSAGIIRPSPGPIQGSSPRGSSGRVHFVDTSIVGSESARMATSILRPVSSSAIPPHRRSASQVVVINRSSSQRIRAAGPRLSDSVLVQSGAARLATAEIITPRSSRFEAAEVIIPSSVRATFEEITPRSSRVSQVSGGVIEIETAGGRRSRRTSTVQAFCTDTDPRNSGTWRPVRQKYVVIDAKGNKKEYYR